MPSTNIVMLQTVVIGLDDLIDDILKFIKLVATQKMNNSCAPGCLISEDSDLSKKGRYIEKLVASSTQTEN
ncbi:MAG: hypothetical protein KAS71_02510 [Bacteroidales bacterium]|nr:hypothetical protein [Bacteroidales bacterium]